MLLFFLNTCFCLTLIQRADTTSKALIEVLAKSSDYLQPNSAVRAKLAMTNTVSKIRGQEQASGYPHPEGLLGDSMIKYGHDLGVSSSFGETFLVKFCVLKKKMCWCRWWFVCATLPRNQKMSAWYVFWRVIALQVGLCANLGSQWRNWQRAKMLWTLV